MAGSRSNPGQTVTRARGRFGTTSFGSQRRLCPAYLLARIFILTGELLAHNATVTNIRIHQHGITKLQVFRHFS
jgi:hypothetical protein